MARTFRHPIGVLPRVAPARLLLLLALASHGVGARAQPLPVEREPATVEVQGRPEPAEGAMPAASSGAVGRSQILGRSVLRPAELLEFVPGMIVSQHSGDGKANQYYLRGFNLDHGTDFATFVDGMPVNMPTHAHGQGYTDLNFLITELVRGIDYRKGVYAAEDGDFGSAGSARIRLVDRLDRGIAAITLGANGYGRLLDANSRALGGGTLLHGVEVARNDGPWDVPQDHRRLSGVLRYALGDGATRQSLTLMAYQSRWRSTDQVPQRAVDQGLIGRFGSLDPSDHGETARTSLSWNLLRVLDDGELRASAYAIRSSLSLYSNFTYFLERPDAGDQFAQSERRSAFGGSVARQWERMLAGLPIRTTAGLQWRHDRLDPVGLYDAAGGEKTGTVQESRVRQTSVGLHAQGDARWTPWLRSIAGLRVDRLDVDVTSSVDGNSGQRTATKASPKLGAVLGPWSGAELFANAALGFHSNDARGVVARVDPRGGEPVRAAPPLVRTRGAEVGLRFQPTPGLQTSMALWALNLDSELVFSGDAGTTEPSGASRRRGLEISGRWTATSALRLDADLAFSQARFTEDQGEPPRAGRLVPGAVRTVASVGATVLQQGSWSGHFRLRYFGPRPLVEDGSVRSRGTSLAYARIAYRIDRDLQVTADVFNLLDRKASDIDYFYTSRLPGEPAGGIAGLHSHPAEPRTLRLTLTMTY